MSAAPLASVADVSAIFRTVMDSEIVHVQRLLRMASNYARSMVATIDDRISSSDLDPEIVADIVATMVIRVLRNEEGLKQETIGGVSATFDDRVASGFLFLTEHEIVMLEPVKAKRSPLGSIKSFSPAVRHAEYELYGPRYGGAYGGGYGGYGRGPYWP